MTRETIKKIIRNNRVEFAAAQLSAEFEKLLKKVEVLEWMLNKKKSSFDPNDEIYWK